MTDEEPEKVSKLTQEKAEPLFLESSEIVFHDFVSDETVSQPPRSPRSHAALAVGCLLGCLATVAAFIILAVIGTITVIKALF